MNRNRKKMKMRSKTKKKRPTLDPDANMRDDDDDDDDDDDTDEQEVPKENHSNEQDKNNNTTNFQFTTGRGASKRTRRPKQSHLVANTAQEILNASHRDVNSDINSNINQLPSPSANSDDDLGENDYPADGDGDGFVSDNDMIADEDGDDDDDDDDYEQEGDDGSSSEGSKEEHMLFLPKQRSDEYVRSTVSMRPPSPGVNAEEDINAPPRRKQRMTWTDVETGTLPVATAKYDKFHSQRWAAIKNDPDFKGIYAYRTGQQIKDKARNMGLLW